MTEQRQYPVPIATDEEITAFLARYGKPYDPETDAYFRDPFIADIREGKNEPIYNAHSYHTKVPPRAIIPYILHYTEPGDVILDPFCGSGMTGVAALMCDNPPEDILGSIPGAKKGARRTILNDLSPAACHIACNHCTPVNVDALKAAFEQLKIAVKVEFESLYGTEHYEPAVGLYDPTNFIVACRLKNPPPNIPENRLLMEEECDWELLSRGEVEHRMGPDALAKQQLPEGVGQFICIPGNIQYTIWSDVYKCQGMVTSEEPTGRINNKTGKPTMKKVRRPRGCGADIVLWDVAVDHETGKVREHFTCSKCGQEWKKIQLKRTATVPVITNYEWFGLTSERSGKRRLARTVNARNERPTTLRELDLIRRVEGEQIPWWIPSTVFDTRGPQYRRNALSARKIVSVNDLFSKRNLRALACLWDSINAIPDPVTRRFFQFVTTAIMHRSSRLNRLRPSGAGDPQSGTIYISSLVREENVGRVLADKQKAMLAGLVKRAEKDLALVTVGHAGAVCKKQSNVIDYIFADPPFGSNIYYSEVNLVWEAWLEILTDTPFEAVVHRKNDGGTKRVPEYTKLMKESFLRMYELLKPGRFATIEFNNSDGQVFEAIKQAARDAGFIIENMVFLDKIQKTFKQIKGDKGEEDVVGHDVIFNLRKPLPAFGQIGARPSTSEGHVSQSCSHTNQELVIPGSGQAVSLEHLVTETIREHLRTLRQRIQKEPKTYNEEHRSTPFLNTMLMNALIPKGVVDVSQINLPYIEKVCGRCFRKVDNRWYLRDEAVGNHKADGNTADLFQAPEEEVAIQDEMTSIEWLRQKLTKTPMRIGELRPHWMRSTVKLTNDISTRLEQYLREHFWLDRQTRRWREPTEDERALMDTSERQQARQDAERFLGGHLRRHSNDEEILSWIDHLYHSATLIEEEAAGLSDSGEADDLPDDAVRLYGMMPRLFQSVLKENVDPTRYTLAQRQCRIAGAKASAQTERNRRSEEVTRAEEEMPLFRDQPND